MRKTVAVLLALSLLTSLCLPALAEGDDLQFIAQTTFLREMGLSAEEWLETETNRAALASLAALELCLQYGDNDELYLACTEGMDSDLTYTAMDDEGLLYMLYFGSSGYAFLLYEPASDLLAGSIIDFNASLGVEGLLQAMVDGGSFVRYHAVPQADIMAYLAELQELMGIE